MDVSVRDCDSSSENFKDSPEAMSDNDASDVCESSSNKTKEAEVEFAVPKPVSAPKSNDKFKKPILIGPRKGPKNPYANNFSKLQELKSKASEIKQVSVNKVESTVKEAPPAPKVVQKEIPAFPLVISDFSDKILPDEFPYTEPSWKGVPEEKYFLEELKSGVIEKEIDLTCRSFTVLGRLDQCHVTMAHPTVSRYHAVLQYRATRQGIYDKGFYLYDMGSTHGTFLNKNRIKAQTYIRIQVGHVMKFGCSTRMFILQGPNEDQEPESEFTVTELKEMKQQELEERQRKHEEEMKIKEEEERKVKEELESKGVDWGMSEDADEETDLSENPYAITTNEELYAEDPKKELKKWFEREGDELSFETEQAERGKMVCRVTLPLDNGKGGDVIIESTGKSKKEATTSCALEACRYIDRLGLFRQSNQESKKRQVRNWEENDFYDSDEDTYFDRTGDVDEKRQKRMRKAGKIKDSVETYESLMENHKALLKRMADVERKYFEMTQAALAGSNTSTKEEDDELDQYMKSLKRNIPNKMEVKMCQTELNTLKEEETRLISLINIARPATLPELKPYIPPKPSISSIQQSPGSSTSCPDEDMSISTTESHQKLDSTPEVRMKIDTSSSNDLVKEVDTLTKPVIGPKLPTESDVNEPVKKKRTRVRQRNQNQKTTDHDQYDSSEYSDLTWQPPKGQTGDGRTSLNDKYGY